MPKCGKNLEPYTWENLNISPKNSLRIHSQEGAGEVPFPYAPNVWNIILHLPETLVIHVGKNIRDLEHLGFGGGDGPYLFYRVVRGGGFQGEGVP